MLDMGTGGLWGALGMQDRAVQQLPWSPLERSANSPHLGWHELSPVSGDCKSKSPTNSSLTPPLNPALPFLSRAEAKAAVNGSGKIILPGQESEAEQRRWVEGPGQVEQGGVRGR